MANPITWRNVNAGSSNPASGVSSAVSALLQSGKGIQDSFNSVAKTITDRNDDLKTANTNHVLANIMGVNSMEEYDKMRAQLAADPTFAGRNVDAQKIWEAMNKRDNTLREDFKGNTEYQNLLADKNEADLVGQIKTAYNSGDVTTAQKLLDGAGDNLRSSTIADLTKGIYDQTEANETESQSDQKFAAWLRGNKRAIAEEGREDALREGKTAADTAVDQLMRSGITDLNELESQLAAYTSTQTPEVANYARTVFAQQYQAATGLNAQDQKELKTEQEELLKGTYASENGVDYSYNQWETRINDEIKTHEATIADYPEHYNPENPINGQTLGSLTRESEDALIVTLKDGGWLDRLGDSKTEMNRTRWPSAMKDVTTRVKAIYNEGVPKEEQVQFTEQLPAALFMDVISTLDPEEVSDGEGGIDFTKLDTAIGETLGAYKAGSRIVSDAVSERDKFKLVQASFAKEKQKLLDDAQASKQVSAMKRRFGSLNQ